MRVLRAHSSGECAWKTAWCAHAIYQVTIKPIHFGGLDQISLLWPEWADLWELNIAPDNKKRKYLCQNLVAVKTSCFLSDDVIINSQAMLFNIAVLWYDWTKAELWNEREHAVLDSQKTTIKQKKKKKLCWPNRTRFEATVKRFEISIYKGSGTGHERVKRY